MKKIAIGINIHQEAQKYLDRMGAALNEAPLLREFLEKLANPYYAKNAYLNKEYDVRVLLNQSLKLSQKNMKLSAFLYGLIVNE